MRAIPVILEFYLSIDPLLPRRSSKFAAHKFAVSLCHSDPSTMLRKPLEINAWHRRRLRYNVAQAPLSQGTNWHLFYLIRTAEM